MDGKRVLLLGFGIPPRFEPSIGDPLLQCRLLWPGVEQGARLPQVPDRVQKLGDSKTAPFRFHGRGALIKNSSIRLSGASVNSHARHLLIRQFKLSNCVGIGSGDLNCHSEFSLKNALDMTITEIAVPKLRMSRMSSRELAMACR